MEKCKHTERAVFRMHENSVRVMQKSVHTINKAIKRELLPSKGTLGVIDVLVAIVISTLIILSIVGTVGIDVDRIEEQARGGIILLERVSKENTKNG